VGQTESVSASTELQNESVGIENAWF
jgi:hypothetical protein